MTNWLLDALDKIRMERDKEKAEESALHELCVKGPRCAWCGEHVALHPTHTIKDRIIEHMTVCEKGPVRRLNTVIEEANKRLVELDEERDGVVRELGSVREENKQLRALLREAPRCKCGHLATWVLTRGEKLYWACSEHAYDYGNDVWLRFDLGVRIRAALGEEER